MRDHKLRNRGRHMLFGNADLVLFPQPSDSIHERCSTSVYRSTTGWPCFHASIRRLRAAWRLPARAASVYIRANPSNGPEGAGAARWTLFSAPSTPALMNISMVSASEVSKRLRSAGQSAPGFRPESVVRCGAPSACGRPSHHSRRRLEPGRTRCRPPENPGGSPRPQFRTAGLDRRSAAPNPGGVPGTDR